MVMVMVMIEPKHDADLHIGDQDLIPEISIIDTRYQKCTNNCHYKGTCFFQIFL